MKNKLFLILIFVFSILFQSRHLFIPAFTSYDWRQWDTYAVIKNFRAEGMNIANPRTNQIYIEAPNPNERLFLLDFPIYTYLSALLTFLVGVSPLAPRIINLIAAGAISIILFRTVKTLKFGDMAAMLSVIFINISPLFQFSASSIQPDMLMFAFFSYWTYLLLTKNDFQPVGLISLSIATLIKPYMFLIALPNLIYDYLNDRHNKKHLSILFIPPFLYSLWLLRGFSSQSGNYWYTAQTWVVTFINSWNFNLWKITFELVIKIMTTIVTLPIIFLAALGLTKTNTTKIRFLLLILGFLINILIFIPGNYNHAYYQLPILFPLCLLAGIGLSTLNLKRDILAIIILATFGICLYAIPSGRFYKELFKQHHIYQKLNNWQFTQTIVPPGKTVIYFNDEVSPVLLNMMGRNGWTYKIQGDDCDTQIQRIHKIKPDYALIFNSYISTLNKEEQSNDANLIDCLIQFRKTGPIYKDIFITVFEMGNT